MKKTLMLTLLTAGALCMSSHAQESVYSANVVGFQEVELQPDGGAQIMATPFETGNNTLLDVFGTNNLRQDNSLAACDKVTIYDPESQTYQRWAQWTDGNFYKANDLSEWISAIQGNPEIPVGTGFWVTSAASEETNTVTFIGDVIGVATQNMPLIEGFQLIGYQYSSILDLANTPDLVASGASSDDSLAATDKITIYDPETEAYQRYGLWTDGNWYKANDLAEWVSAQQADVMIYPGVGFWYEAISNFTWYADNPYPSLFE